MRRIGPPPFARWLLTIAIAPDRRDAVIGDLEEEYARRGDDRRYWREVVLIMAHEFVNALRRPVRVNGPLAFGVLIGTLGAAAQVATLMFSVGPLVLLPYTAIVLASAVYVRVARVTGFRRRFGVVVGAFMLSTVIVYFLQYSVITPRGAGNIPWQHHAWVLGLMVVIGSGLAAAVAQLTTETRPRFARLLPFTLAVGALGTAALFVAGHSGWLGFLATCALILLVCGAYLQRERVDAFWKRYAITAGAFATSFCLVMAIQYLNRPGLFSLTYAWRTSLVLLTGCLLAALVARFAAPPPAIDATK